MNKVLLFNPRAVEKGSPNYRIPNSILQIAASIKDRWQYTIVDGNREVNSWEVINRHLSTGDFKYFACTVMPGPQLKEAIPITTRVRKSYPKITNVWGGYFATNQNKVVLRSGVVDYCINGPGDRAFPELLAALEKNSPIELIRNLIYVGGGGTIMKTPKDGLLDQDALPILPYQDLDEQYSISGYLKKTHLGKKTVAYHSSIGCPFKCSFCAVVPIYEARWKGKSAASIYTDIKYLKHEHGADSIEFHDNNFFVSEQRTLRFSELIEQEEMSWWGEGRIDTIDKYADSTLEKMRASGCKMIFLGAESGDDTLLKEIDKGGRQSAKQIKAFAARLKDFDIVPEYSFVLGFPGPSVEHVRAQVEREIDFIMEIKRINPLTEIIIYIYSPVPTEGSDLYQKITEAGFSFPKRLEEWLEPSWEKFDMRKNPLTPWLAPSTVDRIRDFETVLNAYHPTTTDAKISNFQRKVMSVCSSIRYNRKWFKHPYELKILQRFWLKYRQPEWEGF